MRLSSGRKKSQKPLNNRRWHTGISRKGLFFSFFGGSLLFGSITGINWGMTYTQQHLAPEITQLLAETLDRPVQLGPVEQVSLTHIRIGASTVPATATDRDTITVDAIDIQFNPIASLWQRQVKLTVTLIRPVAFFDQDDAGLWSKIEIDLAGEEQVEVQQVRLRDATITLAPRSKALKSLVNNPEARDIPVAPNRVLFQHVDLNLALAEPEQPLKFNLAGQVETGGRFRLRGEITPETKVATLRLETDKLSVTCLNPFLPPTARFDRGILSSRVRAEIRPDVDLDGTIALNGKASLNDLAVQVEGEPNLFTQTTGQFRFQGQEITVTDAHTAYGQIPFDKVHGTIHLQNGLDLRGIVQSVSIPAFLSTFDLDLPVATKGLLQTTDLRATGPIDGAIFSGTVHDVEPVQFDRVDIAKVDARFTYDTGPNRLALHKVNLTPKAGGLVATRGLAILGKADKGEPDDVMLDLQVKDVPSDAIAQLYNITPAGIQLGLLNANAKVSVINEEPNIQLQWQLTQATYPAQGRVVLANDRLRVQDTQIQIADKSIEAEGELADDRWQFLAQTTEIPVAGFVPGMPGQITGKVELMGTTDRPLDSVQGKAQAQFQISDGVVSVNGTLHQGDWQAQLQSEGIELSGFSPDLPGVLTGDLNLSGSIANLNAESIQARGNIQLSQGISRQNAFLNQPLTASFGWKGDRLEIHQAKTVGLDLSGWLSAQVDNWQKPSITGLDLDVRLQDYDLSATPFTETLPVVVQGKADFQGKVRGTPIAPQLNGKLQLHELVINQLAFDSLLDGDVKFTPDQGLNLNLLGNPESGQEPEKQDQIALKLDNRHRLNALTVRLGQALIQATARSGANSATDRLLATVQNFPLEKLNLSPGEAWGAVGGLLSGRFNIALSDHPTAMGEVVIDRPTLVPSLDTNTEPHPNHTNDRFVGKLHYADHTLALTEGDLQLGAGRYRLGGSFTPSNPPEFTGQLTTESGNLQDLVTLIPNSAWQTLWHQLDILQLPSTLPLPQFVASQPTPTQPIASLPLTPRLTSDFLSQLRGNFSTQINLHNSSSAGLSVNFNLQGQDWHWGEYGIKQITIADSQFTDEQLTLSPVQLRGLVYAPDGQIPQEFATSVTFSGQMGDQQIGQFRAEAIPALLLGRLLNLPIPLAGNLQATATLAGSTTNPEITGTAETTGIRLNTRQIKDLQVMFKYNNNQFQVEDWRLME